MYAPSQTPEYSKIKSLNVIVKEGVVHVTFSTD